MYTQAHSALRRPHNTVRGACPSPFTMCLLFSARSNGRFWTDCTRADPHHSSLFGRRGCKSASHSTRDELIRSSLTSLHFKDPLGNLAQGFANPFYVFTLPALRYLSDPALQIDASYRDGSFRKEGRTTERGFQGGKVAARTCRSIDRWQQPERSQ